MAYSPILNPHPTRQNGIVYLFSANGVNSTTTQLTAGSTFTGTWEDITLYPALSFLAFADQNLTVTIQGALDSGGTKIVSERIISYRANEKLALSIPLNANYFRVVVKNEGGSATTT